MKIGETILKLTPCCLSISPAANISSVFIDFCFAKWDNRRKIFYWFLILRKRRLFHMENTELIIPAPSDPLKKHKSHFSKIGLFYFCGAIIISGVQISVITLIQLIAPQLMVNPNISLIISSLSMYLIAMPLLVIIVRTIPGMVIHKKKMTLVFF